MSYHVYLFCPGDVEDVEALKAVWRDFIEGLDGLAGERCEGAIAGGDWQTAGAPKHSFELSAASARAERPETP